MEQKKTEDFYKYIKQCIILTEKIEQLTEQIKGLKEKKMQIEKVVIPVMAKEMKDKTIQYKDRKICLKNEKVYPHLSYKYLNEKINKFFQNEKPELVAQLCQFLKEERIIKTETVLKI